MKEIKVKITFTEQMLGTKPGSPEVFTEYVAALRKDGVADDEKDAATAAAENADAMEKAMTVFHRLEDGKTPILWDYQIKGFFKDACGSLRRVPGTKSSETKAYKSVIDSCVFVKERKIALRLPAGAKLGVCERPLRAETAQGPRVALAKSETVPAGTTMEFTVILLNPALEKLVREWLDYGKLRGIGQWRNSGCGRFDYEAEE